MSLASLKELLGRRTPGPWDADGEGIWADWTTDRGLLTSKLLFGSDDAGEHDAEAIVQLVRAADELVAVAQRAQELYEEVEMAESVGICLPDRVPSLNLGQAIRALNDVLGGEGT